MTRNEIQESRMREYFIEAAKSIINSEGTRALSVRTVAERAGYSYATLYNYFKNLKELIYYCIVDYIKDCKEFVNQRTPSNPYGRENLLMKSIALCNYFVQYSSRYMLVFTEQTTELVTNQEIGEEIIRLFNDIFGEDYKAIAIAEDIDLDIFSERHKTILIGAMNLYLLRRSKMDYQQFIDSIKKIL